MASQAADAAGTPKPAFDSNTVKTVSKIPLLTINAGPRDGDLWNKRLKEEFTALITYIKNNKAEDNDWFNIKPRDKTGTFWEGKCWNYYKGLKYEFKLEFAIPASYPAAAPELAVPELEGKTAKMYRGGKICLDIHFNPLWQKKCAKVWYCACDCTWLRTLVSGRSSRFGRKINHCPQLIAIEKKYLERE